MGHVALLGDSIFDNSRYVPGGPSVIEHLRRTLPHGWLASLFAVDGSAAEDVERQLCALPDTTHFVVSTGGNNALDYSNLILHEAAGSYAEVLTRMAEIRAEFQREYRAMLRSVMEQRKPVAVCTVYDMIPVLEPSEQTGLALFNETILKEACRAGVAIIDLRLICSEATDYARTSPIEPSITGGAKIARTIARIVTEHDFRSEGSRVFN